MLRFAPTLLSLSIVFYGTPAFADPATEADSPLPARELGLGLAQPSDALSSEQSELDARIAALQDERARINVRAPKAIAITGAAIAGVGGLTAAAAALACAAASSGSGTKCRKKRATNIEIVGGIVAGVGLVTLIGGYSVLTQRNNQRSELDDEILNLKQERASLPANFEAYVSVGETNGLTLAWSF